MRFKLLKPEWGRPLLKDGTQVNPSFVSEIKGDDTLEGDFSDEFLMQRNLEGYNIYYFPNYPSELPEGVKYARGEHINQFDYLFVDMDLKEGIYKSKEDFISLLHSLFLQPSIVVDSGHGIHAYWRIRFLTRDDFVSTQLRLIQFLNTDDSIWTVKQVMRAPGYKNTKKYGEFVDCKCLDGFEDLTYDMEQLDSMLPPITEENQKRATRHLNKLDGIEEEDNLEDIDDTIPEKFLQDMVKYKVLKELWENPRSYQGDRSSADMKLANELFDRDYDKSEAFRVLYNTEKARSRDPGQRQTYAYSTVDKVYKDRPKYYEPSLAEDLRNSKINTSLSPEVLGPGYMDCQNERWRRGQVLGLILGTGVGKTTLSLNIIKHILNNNPKGKFIFFSLEMPKSDIIEKWSKITNNDVKLSNRIHIVSNETSDGDLRHLGLQEIYWITKDIKKATGEDVLGICIDHMGEVSNTVDIRKKPNFNAGGDQEGGYGPIRSLNYQNLCSKVKDIAKSLNVFVIMQSQTRREFDRSGDVPLDKTAAFGASNFEKMVYWLITAWQPLLRVYDETELRATCWQYVKLRKQNKKDAIKLSDPRVLIFDSDTEIYRPGTEEELAEFELMKPKAELKRKIAEKNTGEGITYKNSPNTVILRALKSYQEKKQGG